MTVDAETFRSVLGQWPTGVVLVTTAADGDWHGMTASSFSSVSLTPPLVLVCLDTRLASHRLISDSGAFGISILAKDQAELGRRFAGRLPPAERFAGQEWLTPGTGSPVLANALGWLDCRVVHAYPGGDHTIFVGEVLAADTPRTTGPLLFHSRTWGQLADPLPDRVFLADTGLAAALRRRGLADEPLLAAVRGAGVRTRVRENAAGADRSVLLDSPAGPAPGPGGVIEFRYEGAAAAEAMAAAARAAHCAAVGRIPDAFAADRRARTTAAVGELLAAGCAEIALEEGDEPASPLAVREVLGDVVPPAGRTPVRVALTDRAGLGLANALTAMKSGVRHFDVTLGGLDDGLCSVDLLFLASRLGVEGPGDREALAAAAAELEKDCGEPLPGRTRALGRTAS